MKTERANPSEPVKSLETIVEPDNPLPEITLDQLPGSLRQAMEQVGWQNLMPVQAKAIPYVLAKRDLMVQSRTGSGKTGAFILPLLERIDSDQKHCQVLILVPTRELAVQVSSEAEQLLRQSGIRTAAVFGGVKYRPQIELLQQGAQLVIGTPGRILDHLMQKNLRLDHMQILIFDEADRMLSMGFFPDIQQIQKFLPRKQINGYLFSATFPSFVMQMAGRFLHKPDMLSLSRDHVHVAETEHAYYVVPPMDKDRCLARILEVENPPAALIFCNTKTKVHYVNTVLKRFGLDVDELSSDLDQKARQRVLDRVRSGKLRFLVATDVAARGIDIPELSHVFQYEPPDDTESYIHRAGRTGRAGAAGIALTLVDVIEELKLEKIAKQYKISLTKRDLPTDEDVQKIVAQRITALLEARLRNLDQVQVERMKRFLPLAENLAQDTDEYELLAMLLEDYYQLSLHTPAVLPEPTPQPAPQSSTTSGSGQSKKSRHRCHSHKPRQHQ